MGFLALIWFCHLQGHEIVMMWGNACYGSPVLGHVDVARAVMTSQLSTDPRSLACE
ncbi:hypothetical protein PISMIDRAFT_314049 [Pisolithus microcarpus 441]|uniref:Uncharacterized protein n=1 Tax=Pisolithus microcarpus 441 TaxID=765257 RepID=A0A0C9ZXR9_9AGAM|nr:hypothetical protein PISMIDRAFT_314049 [Pisolithus microcarpus 441]